MEKNMAKPPLNAVPRKKERLTELLIVGRVCLIGKAGLTQKEKIVL